MTLPISGTPWPGVRYGCTTRAGGVSEHPWASLNLALHVGDDPQAVRQNRQRLEGGLPSAPCWLEQVHGTHVVELNGPSPSSIPRADAAITVQTGCVLAIMTADCAPVVFADSNGRAIGVAHAGWRGLAGGVLEATFAALTARLPVARWRAWVGPCIGQASFEVGAEVHQAFVETDIAAADYFVPGRARGKWHADLGALARHRLLAMGVAEVEVANLCTYERADSFFSYRRESTTGRMATLAWLDSPIAR